MDKLIIANWKCNPASMEGAKDLFSAVREGVKDAKNDVVICPPFLYLPELLNINKKNSETKNLGFGSQDCFWGEGPYTGEISPAILKDSGVKYVIIGHSERRGHLHETDEMINKKIKATLQLGLTPILCIGEKKGENAEKVVSEQLEKDLNGIENWKLKTQNLIIAYEPVWAISTSGGEICSPEYAKKMLDFIRQKFNGKIIYGGSVDSKIANNYLEIGYEGVLVGGASLKAEEFVKIVKNA